MPLAFPSSSHGTVAFGFFNIASDMLLLERRFFFADAFCGAVIELARAHRGAGEQPAEASFAGWHIADRAAVGNLHGAIAGVDLHGFVGASYRAHPFPARREDFKQSPEGAASQPQMVDLIARFGQREATSISSSPMEGRVTVAGIDFVSSVFDDLIGYVERGGFPRYRDEMRPAYVEAMNAVLGARSPWSNAGDAL